MSNPDDILEHYLKNTSYYRQTVLSAKTAFKSVWKHQLGANGPAVARERLRDFWTSLSLVSALLLSVSYGYGIEPITSDDPDHETALSLVQVFAGSSLIMSVAVIIISVIYFIEIDNCVTERDLHDFIYNNAWMQDALAGFFAASVLLLTFSAIPTIYITYGWTEFLVVSVVGAIMVCITAALAAIVAGRNRFRLWIRYESPEGQAYMDAVRFHELKELKELKIELDCQVNELKELRELRELKELQVQIEKEQEEKMNRASRVKSGADLE